jgi:hypothetical protein
VTNEEVESLKSGIDRMRVTMANEHASVWQAGVHAIVQEMVLAAAGQALQRAQLAREQLFDDMARSLPPPREQPPVALNGDSYGYLPEDMVDEPYKNPRFMQSDLPQSEVGRWNE